MRIFRRPVPWRDGFAAMEKRFKAEGRPKQALCGVELRCPGADDAQTDSTSSISAIGLFWKIGI